MPTFHEGAGTYSTGIVRFMGIADESHRATGLFQEQISEAVQGVWNK